MTWEEIFKLLFMGYLIQASLIVALILFLGRQNKFVKETVRAIKWLREQSSFSERMLILFVWGAGFTAISALLACIWVNFQEVAKAFLWLIMISATLCVVALTLFDLIERIGSGRNK